ncbi:UDP-glycosyltransferase UGT5-like isoform X2 [Cylas formicarius]|uniref:UDP-glycosyltransferase UGT5-like isoform X2 n=1 Tax=Cylas formicarius TaxID=197179 RepID=UPI002958D75B|nr:UDP-glycosyltransferase UGT5-like isoform X2 [Cylas formicarius]
MDAIRRSMRISRRERIRSDTIKQRMGLEGTITQDIEKKQLTCYGHVERTSNTLWPKRILHWQPTEKRKAINLFDSPRLNAIKAIYLVNKIGLTLTQNTLAHENVQKLIESKEKFDAVIVGQFMNDALKGLAHYFGGHLILFSSVGSSTWVNHLVGNPSLPSYTPEILMSFPAKMTYSQRFRNTLFNTAFNIIQILIFHPKQNEILHKYVPNSTDLDDALYNVSLVLLNSHESVSYPSSTVPCMVHIGGFHIKPLNTLPQSLQDYLDNSVNGAIYFSLGSNVNSKDMPADKKNAFLNVFKRLKLNVLWKYEEDSLEDWPKNIKTAEWFPQQEILAHPNVKLFITHGGYSSTIEAVFYGIPVIAIPIYGDQKMNAVYAETGNFGLSLNWHDITEENLYSRIQEIVNVPKYKENAKKRSQLMRDREIHPMDRAIYWIEYVIKYDGAYHLRVASLELSWFQYYLLDVYGLIFLFIFVICLVLRKLFVLLFCRKRNALQKLKVK